MSLGLFDGSCVEFGAASVWRCRVGVQGQAGPAQRPPHRPAPEVTQTEYRRGPAATRAQGLQRRCACRTSCAPFVCCSVRSRSPWKTMMGTACAVFVRGVAAAPAAPFQSRHPAAPPFHRGQGRRDVARTVMRQAGTGTDSGKPLRAGLTRRHGHRHAGREPGHEDAARVGTVAARGLADDAGDQPRLAGAEPLVLRLEPVPPLRCIRVCGLLGMRDQEAVLVRHAIHLGARREVVGGRAAAMQHTIFARGAADGPQFRCPLRSLT